MCTFYCSLRKKRYTILHEGTDAYTHSVAYSSKRFKPLSNIWLYQSYWWIRRNTNKEFSCVMVLIMRPGSTFQLVFGYNESLSNLFRTLLNLRKSLVLYLGCGCMTFDFTTQLNDFESLPTWLAKTAKYIPKFWEIFVKRKYNLNLISHIKNSTFDHHFIYTCMVQTFLKIVWWWYLVPRSKRFLISSATLSCKTCNISTFPC